MMRSSGNAGNPRVKRTHTIALISAVTSAIKPATIEIKKQFESVTIWNILDDRLLEEAGREGGLTRDLYARMRRLIDHALIEGADGVLLTCSLYGPVATDSREIVPVMAPDQAAFEEIVSQDYNSILLIASTKPSMEDSLERLQALYAGKTTVPQFHATVVEGAHQAVIEEDSDALAEALFARTQPYLDRIDAIFLAQYSLAPAMNGMMRRTSLPVISGPRSAARLLKEVLK